MDVVERLHTIRAHLRTGALGQREVWEEWLTEAAAEAERLRAERVREMNVRKDYRTEIERLTAERDLNAAALECYSDEQRRLRAEIGKLRAHLASKISLTEVEELRAEIERLRTQCGGNCRYWEGRWRDEWAENERLKARIAELEQRATDGEIQAAVRAALGGKNPWNA